jgi:hypothetical protein
MADPHNIQALRKLKTTAKETKEFFYVTHIQSFIATAYAAI